MRTEESAAAMPLHETSDLTLASFLRCRGFEIAAIRRDDEGRTAFAFAESDALRHGILDFANDGPVGARSFSNTLRDLKGLARVAGMSRKTRAFVAFLPFLFLAASGAVRADEERSVVREGVSIELSLLTIGPEAESPGALREGRDAEVRFRIRDAATGTAMSGLRPAAWLDVRGAGEAPAAGDDCRKKVQSFLGAGLTARPVTDLNIYYVLALNDDASVSVVDPLFGFGGSKLLTTVLLDGPGSDWALSAAANRLYVSVPSAHQLAVVDTSTWKVTHRLDVGDAPARVLLQPDGRYLWVANDGKAGGVTVVDTDALRVVARIKTGPGRHEIVFTSDGRYAFVLNRGGAGSLSVVDVRTLAKVRDLATGDGPTDLAYSELADAVYVVHAGDGTIAVVDGHRHEIVSRIRSKPGLKRVRFVPGGRWGIAVNAKENAALVVDASTHRIVQVVAVGKDPDQISFTATGVFIRSNGTEMVSVLPIVGLGQSDSLAVSEFPGGQTAPGLAGASARGAAIVPAPEGGAVLVANPADKTIYYYSEGMAAPMGSFKNYGRQPKAVLVADRGLRESAPGVYSTTVKLPPSGRYDMALLIDSPPVAECFEVAVAPDPKSPRGGVPSLKIETVSAEADLKTGTESRLAFRLTDAVTGEAKAGLADLEVQLVLPPGTWNQTVRARGVGNGVYETMVTLPKPGVYFVSFRSHALGANYHDLPPVILRAVR